MLGSLKEDSGLETIIIKNGGPNFLENLPKIFYKEIAKLCKNVGNDYKLLIITKSCLNKTFLVVHILNVFIIVTAINVYRFI